MKNPILTLASIAIFWACTAPVDENAQSSNDPTAISFDSLLAAETGADVYGMRSYVIAYLLKGPNRDQDSLEAAQIQRAHLDNIKRMAEQGKLVLAGPYLDDHGVQGIYVFAVESIEEAEELTRTDPAIKAGRLVMEMHPWYGSAALMKVGDLHTQLAKQGI
ncbi:MAG: YciI family protein [Cyclobacteriaceae bacterium]